MARSNSFFGIRRGKAMGMVFSHGQDGYGNSQQITRALPENVANPRTSSQQYSRMIASTVAKSYGVLKPLADHSTEGVSYGQQSMNAFLRRNQQLARIANDGARGFAPYQLEGGTVFEGCQLSKGSVGKCEVYSESTSDEWDIAQISGIAQFKGNTEIEIASHYGFENVGDVATLAVLINSRAENEYTLNGLTVMGTPLLAYVRLKLKKQPTTTPVNTKTDFDALFDYSDTDNVKIDFALDATQFPTMIDIHVATALQENGYAPEMWCQVMSHNTIDGWKRSNAAFVIHGGADNPGVEKGDAEESYPVGTQKILNGAGM